ncbi:Rieske 2Fe-2S domain-containing protein [Scytonema sp. PCC 10023]|uniref:MstN n=1 Tax=Scytonema sp. PCC 10023 TaxID=1680591 RepID=A0A2D1CM92_9CYAN|nr:MstN [Scytonema sp. PCC 10023]
MVTNQEKLAQPKLTQPGTRANKEVMRLAASWYIAMPSLDLGKKPIAIELFGQPLVAWRDQTGRAAIMDRYCSHLGASLAVGQVVDGCIRCPYHHWCYDSSGECVSAPELEHIPPKARQATYYTIEKYGYIWVWYGSKVPLFPLPEFPSAEAQRHKYMAFRYAYATKTTVQRVVEAGGCDYYHAISLHNFKMTNPSQFTIFNNQDSANDSEPVIQKEAYLKFQLKVWNRFMFEHNLLGPIAQILGLSADTFTFQTDIWPSGCRMTGFADNNEHETLKVLFCTTPINENMTIAHFFVMLRKTGNFLLDIPYSLIYRLRSRIISDEDISVLDTIKHDGGGAYIYQDRGVLEHRKLYQRWVDKVE